MRVWETWRASWLTKANELIKALIYGITSAISVAKDLRFEIETGLKSDQNWDDFTMNHTRVIKDKEVEGCRKMNELAWKQVSWQLNCESS